MATTAPSCQVPSRTPRRPPRWLERRAPPDWATGPATRADNAIPETGSKPRRCALRRATRQAGWSLGFAHVGGPSPTRVTANRTRSPSEATDRASKRSTCESMVSLRKEPECVSGPHGERDRHRQWPVLSSQEQPRSHRIEHGRRRLTDDRPARPGRRTELVPDPSSRGDDYRPALLLASLGEIDLLAVEEVALIEQADRLERLASQVHARPTYEVDGACERLNDPGGRQPSSVQSGPGQPPVVESSTYALDGVRPLVVEDAQSHHARIRGRDLQDRIQRVRVNPRVVVQDPHPATAIGQCPADGQVVPARIPTISSVPQQDEVARVARCKLRPLVTIPHQEGPAACCGERSCMSLQDCGGPILGSIVHEIQDEIAPPKAHERIEAFDGVTRVVPVQNNDRDGHGACPEELTPRRAPDRLIGSGAVGIESRLYLGSGSMGGGTLSATWWGRASASYVRRSPSRRVVFARQPRTRSARFGSSTLRRISAGRAATLTGRSPIPGDTGQLCEELVDGGFVSGSDVERRRA